MKNLDPRVRRVLAYHGFDSFEKIVNADPAELLRLSNFAKKSLDEVIFWLAEYHGVEFVKIRNVRLYLERIGYRIRKI